MVLFLLRSILRKFMMKANARYRIIGDPNVRKDAYMKDKRMLEVGIRNFSPSLVQTPNAYFSISSCITKTIVLLQR